MCHRATEGQSHRALKCAILNGVIVCTIRSTPTFLPICSHNISKRKYLSGISIRFSFFPPLFLYHSISLRVRINRRQSWPFRRRLKQTLARSFSLFARSHLSPNVNVNTDIYIQGRPFERERGCTTCRGNISTANKIWKVPSSVYTISYLSLLSREKIEGRKCAKRRQVRRIRAVVPSAKIRQEGGQIVNFTFFSEISLFGWNARQSSSQFSIFLKFVTRILSPSKRQLTKAGFSDRGTFFGSIKFAGKLFLFYISSYAIRVEMVRIGAMKMKKGETSRRGEAARY